MALALDSSVDGGDNGGSTNSLTFAFNNLAGDLLFVGFVADDAGVDDITGVTYNGVACTLIDKRVTGTVNRFTYLYVLSSPATGSHNVVISCTANHYLIAGAVSYSGSNLSGQPDASTTSLSGVSVTTWTTSLSSVADNCWHMLVEGGYDGGDPPGAGAGTTRRVYNAAFGAWGLFDSNSAKTPAGSVSLVTTYPLASSNGISHVMASFKPTLPGQTPYPWQLKSQMGALLTQ